MFGDTYLPREQITMGDLVMMLVNRFYRMHHH